MCGAVSLHYDRGTTNVYMYDCTYGCTFILAIVLFMNYDSVFKIQFLRVTIVFSMIPLHLLCNPI